MSQAGDPGTEVPDDPPPGAAMLYTRGQPFNPGQMHPGAQDFKDICEADPSWSSRYFRELDEARKERVTFESHAHERHGINAGLVRMRLWIVGGAIAGTFVAMAAGAIAGSHAVVYTAGGILTGNSCLGLAGLIWGPKQEDGKPPLPPVQ